MSNEDIIKQKYPHYDENIAQKDVELCGEQIQYLMDAARRDEAIAFHEWAWVNVTAKDKDNGLYYVKGHTGEVFTKEQLYQLFKQTQQP